MPRKNTTSTTHTTTATTIAALAQQGLYVAATTAEITVDGDYSRIQLLPYGEFRAGDGRPADVPHWIVADDNGKDICTIANSYTNKLVVDYEHQTLKSADNGQPAPAAGWMDYFYLTPKGVYAEVTWTDKAKQLILDNEYKYISPVFIYDKHGYVRKIINAALTNAPALDGMDEVVAAALDVADITAASLDDAHQAKTKKNQKPKNQGEHMELLELLKALLNLPDADEEQLQAALSTIAQRADADGIALTDVYDRVAALSAKHKKQATPDPAQFVPIKVVSDLQAQVAVLSQQINADKSQQMVTAALSDGRLLPAQEDWALALANKDPQAFADYVATVQPIAALSANQTGTAGVGDDTVSPALTAEQLAVCQALDIAPDDFKKTLAEDANNE